MLLVNNGLIKHQWRIVLRLLTIIIVITKNPIFCTHTAPTVQALQEAQHANRMK